MVCRDVLQREFRGNRFPRDAYNIQSAKHDDVL